MAILAPDTPGMSLVTWIPDRVREYRQRLRDARSLFADNDAKAREMQTDLDRWLPDRGRRLDGELRGMVNGAGNQLYAGSLRTKLEGAIERALHEYRDEASAKVRAFAALARSEAGTRKGSGPSLVLSDES